MLRNLVIALMLLAAPFAQARAVLACTMMHGEVVRHCHCPHEQQSKAAPATAESQAPACCVTLVEVEEAVTAPPPAAPEIRKLWDFSPDLATAPPVAVSAATSTAVSRYFASPPRRSFGDGTHTWLRTARLRI